MTVEWIKYAQSLTDKPVKGMLTGPVTILAWSFVRDDQPLADTANQVALAIRDETVDLQAAGIAVIQVDEPALRELLPLRRADQEEYLHWAVGSFRLATSGVADSTQIHTHLCYSEFGEVIGAIADLDADVTSIEAARSHMEVLDDLNSIGFSNSVGPGVYDIHSPRVPSTERDGRVAARRAASRSGRAAVGQSRLRAEDPQRRRGDRVAEEHGRRGASRSGPASNLMQPERHPGTALGLRRHSGVTPDVRLGGQLDRNVVGPGLAGDHVRHPNYAALELTGRRVDQPILLRLLVDRLRVKQNHPHLAGLEVAALLHRGDQLLVVHVAVAEVPADGGAADSSRRR